MPKTLTGNPRQDGFRMPAEFEPHNGCWMLWPERGDNWRLGARPAQMTFARAAGAIARFEPVTMCVSGSQYENARRRLPDAVRVVEMSSNDSWMRDMGPTFVVNDETGEVRGVHWMFNAWGGLNGGLYFPWDQDALVGRKVIELENLDRYPAPLTLEGGAIHVDGQGALITTRECLLNPNRNPGVSEEEIEALLKSYLNIEKVIWLNRGLDQDETDGHVDNLCCFTRPGHVLLNWTEDPSDPQYEIVRDAFELLSNSGDARGRALTVHKIHQPGPLFMTPGESEGLDRGGDAKPRKEGDRLVGSYVNFYIANQGVVMPLFDDPRDGAALEAIAALFPGRKVTGVPSREILLGGGNIHCITQQQPKGRGAGAK
ncbi:MAG: agmatine deiminase [Desulfobacterales bacterium]|nr:agmatine deiminase [Desulfobacterales bacterium]